MLSRGRWCSSRSISGRVFQNNELGGIGLLLLRGLQAAAWRPFALFLQHLHLMLTVIVVSIADSSMLLACGTQINRDTIEGHSLLSLDSTWSSCYLHPIHSDMCDVPRSVLLIKGLGSYSTPSSTPTSASTDLA